MLVTLFAARRADHHRRRHRRRRLVLGQPADDGDRRADGARRAARERRADDRAPGADAGDRRASRCGLAGALLMTRVVARLLFAVEPTDPLDLRRGDRRAGGGRGARLPRAGAPRRGDRSDAGAARGLGRQQGLWPGRLARLPACLPRFKLTIEYAGTRYSGWQIQKNAQTIQGEIDRAVRDGHRPQGLRALRIGPHRRRRPRARRRSRTSTSARRCRPTRCAAASTTSCRPTSTSSTATQVPHRFHARHDAVARRYLYQIARRRTAFAKPYVWWVKEPLDVARMRERPRAFVGMRDFQSFAAPTTATTRRAAAVDARARRSARHHRRRRPGARRHRGLALPVEDGAPDRRRARRDRTRARSTPTRRRAILRRAVGAGRRAHRAAVGPVSRARLSTRRRRAATRPLRRRRRLARAARLSSVRMPERARRARAAPPRA